MRFESLSDAIRYYSAQNNPLSNSAPYGQLAIESALPPQNINNFSPANPSGIVYGRSVWGVGMVIGIDKPTL